VIELVIDTSIFRQDPPRKKAASRALERLGKGGHIRLHIPYFVRREFLSHLMDEHTKPVREMQRSLHDVQRKLLQLGIKAKALPKNHQLEKLCKTIETTLERDFVKWTKRINAKLHPIRNHHGGRIGNGYFDGSAPFSSKKVRNYIPDAFIFQTILDLSRKVDRLHVITADGTFSEACKNTPKVYVHNSLEAFIKTDDCIALLKNQDFVDHLPQVIQKLEEEEQTLITNLSSVLEDSLSGHEFRDDHIPSDGSEASIAGTYDASGIEFDFNKVEYLGGGTVLLPFSCKVDAYVDFYIFKSDYYCLSDERMNSISTSEYGNDHYYLAQERLELNVAGKVSITFDLESLKSDESVLDNFDVMLDEAAFDVNDVDDISVVKAYY
jgi:hypothetical protein